MNIKSSAFQENQTIPTKHTYYGVEGGKNISLPFSWNDVPSETKSFALSIVDPHPVAKNWVHWFVIDIPATITGIAEGASPRSMPNGSRELLNTYGSLGYGGPEPPKGSGKHPYVVTLYALGVPSLGLSEMTTLTEFTKALRGNVIATTSITGTYDR
ncbi:MAG: YbhB/YbcL family Raf kinase inhibitor-like protein [Bacteriovoracaceae bacterium]|nr:YbhB/YbcL family Raf kinase inhibitor-like protein [Bacteroidota bacterium]